MPLKMKSYQRVTLNGHKDLLSTRFFLQKKSVLGARSSMLVIVFGKTIGPETEKT